MKKLTRKQKQIFIDHGDCGFDNLRPEDFKDTELATIISEWRIANNILESLFEQYSEELDE